MNQPEFRTVGMRLRAAREALGLSLQEAARATSIRFNHLQELENDHPEVFNSAVQARGFLRLYAAFLKLNSAELISLWESPAKPDEAAEFDKQENDAPPFLEDAPQLEVQPEAAGQASDEIPTERASLTPPSPEDKSQSGKTPTIGERIRMLFSRVPIPQNIRDFFANIPKPVRKSKTQASQPQVAVEKSQDIFQEIGAVLRDRRVAMDLDLTDIEHFTNLKRMVLVAIEDGRFGDLPSTVQGRGMLNNYAKFLALDDSGVMDRYALALQLQREERMPSRKAPEPAVSVKVNLPDGIRRVLNPDLVIGGAVILVLFGFILWGASQMLASDSAQPTDAPSISEMLQLTPSVSPTPDLTGTADAALETEQATALPGVAIAQSTPTPVATANAAPLQLYIIAHDRAFMRVAVDGISAFDGRIIPDNVYTYSGNDLITLLTGNGAALEVYFNQDFLGKLGEVGEVVDLRFSAQGLQTPTPLPQPTATQVAPGAAMEDAMTEDNELP